MNSKDNILNKQEIIKAALGGRNLDKKQLKAIEQIVNGYSHLIGSSLSLPPEKSDATVIMENIRSSILLTLLILETYVQPKQVETVSSGPTGIS